MPITVLIRALGIGTNAEIKELFGEEPKILASIEKDPSDNYEDGLLELYKKIRPGEPLSVDSAESLINSMFFDPRRYDLAKVGRYKFNKKLALRNRISGFILAEDVLDPTTGEVLAEAGTNVDMELADKIQNAAVASVMIQTEEGATKYFNMEVNLALLRIAAVRRVDHVEDTKHTVLGDGAARSRRAQRHVDVGVVPA